MFTNPRIDGELRAMIQTTFREFCDPPAVQGNINLLLKVLLYIIEILFFLGDPIKNEEILMDNILSSLKEDLVSENEDLNFSDEESDTSPKKLIAVENNIPAVKTTPGILVDLIFINLYDIYTYELNAHLL